MSTTPLLVDGGVFLVGPGDTDFSDAIDSVSLSVEAAEVDVPQTLATPKTVRLGSRTYKLKLKYFANDTSTTAELFGVFWDAITNSDGILDFKAQLRAGSVTASNPQWQGQMVVSSAEVGGDVGTFSESAGTFTLVGEPTRATS